MSLPIRKFYRDKYKEIIKNWDDNLTLSQLAKKFNVSVSCIQLIRRHTLGYKKLPTKKGKFFRSNIDYIRKNWDPNLDMTALSLKLKIPVGNLANYKRLLGLKNATHVKAKLRRLMDRETIDYLLKRGFNGTDCARLFKSTRQRIDQIMSGL